jgi:hypothetical protein
MAQEPISAAPVIAQSPSETIGLIVAVIAVLKGLEWLVNLFIAKSRQSSERQTQTNLPPSPQTTVQSLSCQMDHAGIGTQLRQLCEQLRTMADAESARHQADMDRARVVREKFSEVMELLTAAAEQNRAAATTMHENSTLLQQAIKDHKRIATLLTEVLALGTSKKQTALQDSSKDDSMAS